jgi:hypothetical protein
MNPALLAAELERLAELDGLLGCALVDADTGMIWQAAGAAGGNPLIAEAAVDYWRLYKRRSPVFGSLGELRAQVVIHSQGRLTLVACGPDLVLVSLSAEPDRVDWARWKALIGQLGVLTASF